MSKKTCLDHGNNIADMSTINVYTLPSICATIMYRVTITNALKV